MVDVGNRTIEPVLPAMEAAMEVNKISLFVIQEAPTSMLTRIIERFDFVRRHPDDDKRIVVDLINYIVPNCRELLLTARNLPHPRPHPLPLELPDLLLIETVCWNEVGSNFATGPVSS